MAAPLTLILKTSGTTESTIQPREGIVEVGGDSKARRDGRKLERIEIDDNEVSGGKVDDKVGKKGHKMSKSKNLFQSKKSSMSKKVVGFSDFLNPGAKLMFTKLKQALLKDLILYYFDLEHNIRIKTEVSGYAIGGVLTQLTLGDLGWWYPMAFFSCKMFLAETRYEICNSKLLAIIEAFKS